MMEIARHKEQFKQIRTMWGWGFVAAWIVLWCLFLEAAKEAAYAQYCPETIWNGVSEVFVGKGNACRAAADGNFAQGIVFAVLTSPIGIFFAHAFAKWRMQQIVAAEERASSQIEEQRRVARERNIADVSRKTAEQQTETRSTNARFELITRLGAVDDQLIVLAAEKDDARVTLIHLTIAQAIRDIHAKFTREEARAFAEKDAGIGARVNRTLSEMEKLNLRDTRLYSDLSEIFADHADA